MLLTRRHFFSLLPAPLIVSAANIMPVKMLEPERFAMGVDSGWFDLEWDGQVLHIRGGRFGSRSITIPPGANPSNMTFLRIPLA